MTRLRLCGGAAAVALLAVGCGGDGIVRRELSGTVVVDGGPLGSGLIEFEPLDGQKTRTSTEVKDGKFRIAQDQGLSDGSYQVRISGTGRTDPIPVPPGHVGMPVVPKEWWPVKLPDKYNKKSELTAKVTAGPNVFPFDLVGGKVMEVKGPPGQGR